MSLLESVFGLMCKLGDRVISLFRTLELQVNLENLSILSKDFLKGIETNKRQNLIR